MIAFASPLTFALALMLALPMLWRLRHFPIGGARRRWVIGLSGAAILAGVLAAGGLEFRRSVDRMAVVFVLDRSRSATLDEDELQRELRAAQGSQRADDVTGLVVFGQGAATEVVPSASPSLSGRSAEVGRDQTDIGSGIRRALADMPAEYSGRIVLVSDGLETHGDALGAAALAAARGVMVEVRPVERSPQPEMAVERVRVPDAARPGEPVEIRVVTRTSAASPARVQVFRDGELIADTETELRAGTDVLVLQDEAPEFGVHRYDAVLTPQTPGSDEGVANNRGGAFLRVIGGSQTLVVAGEMEHAAPIVRVLQEQGSHVRLIEGRELPQDLAGLAAYDLIVFHDVGARMLSEEQLRAIQSYVRDLGGGFLMAGARQSFGLGGYTGTRLEEAMPVRFDLRQRRERLSLAMVIAIDRSGSMSAPVGGGRTKLDLANEAAARSASLLSPDDRIGVMHVDTSPSWTQPMTSVDNPADIATRVRRAQPGGGGIYVDVTLRASYAALGDEAAQLKHLLLFSDGSDSAQMSGARAQVSAASRAGITTSVVSMGRGPDTPELEVLSSIGGGRFYIVEDLTELPRIFTQETMEASRAALREEPFRPTLALPSPVTRGLDFGAAPELLGHAIVNARPRGSVLLWAADEEPLLAHWRHGLGQSAVYTTDFGTELGAPWLRWDGFPTLLDRLTRSMQRQPQDVDTEVGVRIEAGEGHVFVDAIRPDGQPIEDLALSGTISGPSGDSIPVALRQTGPGRYEGDFDASENGPYLVSVEDTAHGAFIGSAGAVRAGGDELRGDGTNYSLLTQIAAMTGGRVHVSAADALGLRPPPVSARQTLVPLCVALALLFLLLSVAARRLSFPKRAPAVTLASAGGPRGGAHDPRRKPAPTDRGPSASDSRADSRPDQKRDASAESHSESNEDDDPDPPAPEAPATLAEQLLARKKRR